MATKTLISLAMLIALSAVFTLAATKPDFSGTWTMDRARSFGLPANMNQTMIVSQAENKIEVETKLIQPGNERSVKDTYTLDGKEYEFTPPVPPNAPANQPPPRRGRAVPGTKRCKRDAWQRQMDENRVERRADDEQPRYCRRPSIQRQTPSLHRRRESAWHWFLRRDKVMTTSTIHDWRGVTRSPAPLTGHRAPRGRRPLRSDVRSRRAASGSR